MNFKLLIFGACLLLLGCKTRLSLQSQYRETKDPLSFVDSISEVHHLALPDTSNWIKSQFPYDGLKLYNMWTFYEDNGKMVYIITIGNEIGSEYYFVKFRLE
jgi:hypothetical protein